MKKIITYWQEASVRVRVEIIAQALLYLLIAPRAYLFFFGSSADTLWSLRSLLFGALITLIFVGSYIVALLLMKNTTARERWALFILSFVLIPLPLGVAYALSQKLKNMWASVLGAFVGYVVLQIAMSVLFRQYLLFIEQIVR